MSAPAISAYCSRLSEAQRAAQAAAIEHELRGRALDEYRPYAKQRAFHEAGVAHRERLLMAGNQLGKTIAGGAEWGMHLTGQYPDWWTGHRFDRPITIWAASVTNVATRDNVQAKLVGPPAQEEAWGTGFIPRRALLGWKRASGTADLLDSVTVRHISGGVSTVGFKSYEQGRPKWQGPTLDGLWFDEEPPEDIYSEGLTRTNAVADSRVTITFTPLLGMSRVVKMFVPFPSTEARHVTSMTIDDAEHYTPERRAEIIASYPAHEREARAKGIPVLGSGVVFPVVESSIAVQPVLIPSHWPQLGALDFGWDHPTAAVRVAWDRDTDTMYVIGAYRRRQASVIEHAAALRPWGESLPWAWPHDGLQHDKGSGEQLAAQYRKAGLAMLPERATFPDGSNGLEAGVAELLTRMQTGRLKVFAHVADWFEEFRSYHRKDGLIVDEDDDLMSATRYAAMSLRFAAVLTRGTSPMRKLKIGGIV